MDVCLRVLKESSKIRFDSYSVRNSVLIISHITFRECCVHIFPTAFLEIAECNKVLQCFMVYTAQPYCAYKTTTNKTRKFNPRSGQRSL